MQQTFELFGTAHLASLLVVGVLAILLPLGVRRLRPDWARPVAWLLALLLLAQETVHLWQVAARYGLGAELLPLDLSAMAVLLSAWVLLTGSPRVFEIIYFWAFSATTQALLTPDLAEGFPSLRYILFFLSHGLVVVSVCYAMIVYRLRPYPASIPRAAGMTLAFAVLVAVANLQLGTNFMYLMAKPDRPSLMDWLGPWPWYWLSLLGLALLAFLVLYAPWFIADRRGRRRNATGR
ncbi:MAG: TIGR02206 family membrane protein [Chromatiaceae bacterium]|nr:MAG: TIGR02206 family membrane protein [Chromatiaceae bacterium]